jgi:predicted lipid-binding transport protein (Tim44 family)
MPLRKKTSNYLIILCMVSLLFIMAGPAFATDSPVGKLTAFSGTVLIKSQGNWGVEPSIGLPLYTGDKIVTKSGTASITFTDGGVLDIKKNSNMQIDEAPGTEGVAVTKTIKRKITLLLGKMAFKTGSGANKADTVLQTTTMVCGLRGTAGTLSIGADGQTYIQFDEGGTAYTIGDFISGIAEDVPEEIANLNPAQKAAIVAAAAASQAKNATELAAKAAGTPEAKKAQAQAAYAAARAAEAAATEAKTQATIIAENNPDTETAAQAAAAAAAADAAIESAKDAQQDAISNGASETTPVTSTVTEPTTEQPGFDVDVQKTVNDLEFASPV